MAAGTYNISASCIDDSNLQTSTASTLVVEERIDTDQEAPLITVPEDMLVTIECGENVAVNFTVTAFDSIDGPRAVSCLPESGQLFPVGDTTVTCSASDHSGNTANNSFLVSVASSPNSETRTVRIQWNIPTARTDGTPLSPTELESYSLAYSSSATLNAATILDIPASNQSGELISEYIVTLPSAGNYYLGMAVSDNLGNMSDLSEIEAISVP